MSRLFAVSLGLLAYALLCFFAVRVQAPKIQQDLISRTRETLAAKNVFVCDVAGATSFCEVCPHYGTPKPIGGNDDEELRQKNRRIEFHLEGEN